MKNRILLREALLLLTALIWGFAFVAQSKGGDKIGPLTFACLRYFMAAAVLYPVIRLVERPAQTHGLEPIPLPAPAWDVARTPMNAWRRLPAWVRGGIVCGFFLALCSMFQQLGINLGDSVGKAGFLTACYVVLVPLVGLCFGRKCGPTVTAAAVLTLLGLWLLCGVEGRFTLTLSDVLLLLCALSVTFQIIFVDRYSPLLTEVQAMKLSLVQFLAAGTFALGPMLVFEVFGGDGPAAWVRNFASWDAWIPLLYAAVLSSAVGYTLQCVGQRGVNPTVASLLMSLESVFAALAGWLLLHERLSVRELCGCGIVFAAVVLAQVQTGKGVKRE